MVFEIYLDNIDEWRWRLIARNGRIVADSGEGYNTRAACRVAIHRIKEEIAEARTRVVPENRR